MLNEALELIDQNFVIAVFGGVLGTAIFGSMVSLFKKSYKLPLIFKTYRKSSRYKQLIKIKNNRQDERYYLYELQKSQNWFIVFMLVLILNFIWLINNHILSISMWWFLIFMTPSFIVEIIWLNKLSYIEDLRVYQKGSLEWKKRQQRKVRRRKRN